MAKKSGKNVYLVALLLFLGASAILRIPAFPKTASISSMFSEALAIPSDS